MNKILILFLTVIFLTHCTKDSEDNKDSVFSYEELVEIYSITQYLTNIPSIKELLDRKYDLIDYERQTEYYISLSKIKTTKNWNQFIKNTINYYISLKKATLIQYYTLQGYDEQLNLFNDNELLSPPFSQNEYWKVYYLSSRLPIKFLVLKELFKNNRCVFQTYYDENRSKLKEIDLVNNVETYYDNNIKMQ